MCSVVIVLDSGVVVEVVTVIPEDVSVAVVVVVSELGSVVEVGCMAVINSGFAAVVDVVSTVDGSGGGYSSQMYESGSFCGAVVIQGSVCTISITRL